MNKYTIFCTESQTRKALKLGAPIERFNILLSKYSTPSINDGNGIHYEAPTAEQMIGFLEEQASICSIEIDYDTINKVWMYFLYTNKEETTEWKSLFLSRKEATLEAIDAALDYLTNNKQL